MKNVLTFARIFIDTLYKRRLFSQAYSNVQMSKKISKQRKNILWQSHLRYFLELPPLGYHSLNNDHYNVWQKCLWSQKILSFNQCLSSFTHQLPLDYSVKDRRPQTLRVR